MERCWYVSHRSSTEQQPFHTRTKGGGRFAYQSIYLGRYKNPPWCITLAFSTCILRELCIGISRDRPRVRIGSPGGSGDVLVIRFLRRF
jgi:hypothetical protein